MCSLTYAAVIALGSCAALMSQAQSTSSTSLDQPSIIRAKKTNPQDGLEYVWIKPGTYFTGCDHDDKECIGWERPRHAIVIDKGYWMGETEVTQAGLRTDHGHEPKSLQRSFAASRTGGLEQGLTYCTRTGMRLPTESEWEFGALGGSQQPRYGAVGTIAWYDANSADMTHDVGQKLPNPYGLFDMLGNVWEWVQDICEYDQNRRIMKGGSFYNLQKDLRVSNREAPISNLRHRNVGFRCVGDIR